MSMRLWREHFATRLTIWSGLAFVVGATLTSQALFSSLGFNPTDDGWILACSRRLLDLQVPYRDFITVHTVGSCFLSAPIVYFGGPYVFWLSRFFAWFEFASIAWAWAQIIGGYLETFNRLWEKFALAAIAFALSAHFFPILSFPTIDALFVTSIGVWFCARGRAGPGRYFGLFLIGSSPLFRQNFLPFVLVSIITFGAWRKKWAWVAASLPIVVYVTYVFANHALPEAILQLTTYSYREVWRAGFTHYLVSFRLATFSGLALGFVGSFLTYAKLSFKPLIRAVGASLFLVIPFGASWSLGWHPELYLFGVSFVTLGAVVAITWVWIFKDRGLSARVRCGVLVASIAWTTGLSIGYASPALGMGPMCAFLIGCGKGYPSLHMSELTSRTKSCFRFKPKHLQLCVNVLFLMLLATSLFAFAIARTNYIYRERPSSNLTYNLGDVLVGGNLIKIDNNTYLFLKDLEEAENLATKMGKSYAVIPDLAATWVENTQPNPLPMDWLYSVELGGWRVDLVNRVIADLASRRGTIIVIVQKYEAASIAWGLQPLNPNPVVQYVRSNFTMIDETQYFELYE